MIFPYIMFRLCKLKKIIQFQVFMTFLLYQKKYYLLKFARNAPMTCEPLCGHPRPTLFMLYFTKISIHLSVCLSVRPSVRLRTCPSVNLSICLCVYKFHWQTGTCRCLTDVIYYYSYIPAETEEDHERPQSRQSVSQHKLEPGTSRT